MWCLAPVADLSDVFAVLWERKLYFGVKFSQFPQTPKPDTTLQHVHLCHVTNRVKNGSREGVCCGSVISEMTEGEGTQT